jgi:LysR family glycine cleavage system transcriptional activator
LLRDGPALRRPADLRHYSLLHNAMSDDWSRWLRAAGAHGVDATRGPRFGDCSLMMQAAVEGQGVALAFAALVSYDLAANRLVELFDVELLPEAWYYILVPRGGNLRPKVAAFRDWLRDEAAAQALDEPRRRVVPVRSIA